MTWYNTGTVSVTNNGTAVTGSGTSWTTYVDAGQAFVGPDGLAYEIATVVSATSITLASAYKGATASGQAYRIMPVQGYVRDLALSASDLLLSFSSVRDNAGQGMFSDGSPATPGVRFSADQDTGFYRPGTNLLGLVTNGTERVRVDASGNVGIGVTSPSYKFDLQDASTSAAFIAGRFSSTANASGESKTSLRIEKGLGYGAEIAGYLSQGVGSGLILSTVNAGTSTERARIDGNGNFGIGTSSPAGKLHVKSANETVFIVEATAGSSWFQSSAPSGMILHNVVNSPTVITTNATEKMRIEAGGNVGIGTSSPASKLDVNGSLAVASGSFLHTPYNGATNTGTVRSGVQCDGVNQTLNFYTANGYRGQFTSGGNLVPGADNAQALGSAGGRWSVLYATTGTINTSDARSKQDITPIPDEWLDAWGDVDWKRYKFIDAVQAKGDDARWHLGLVAQAVRDAFAARGLDAATIGLLCFDQWDEEVEPIYETVTKTRIVQRPTGNMLLTSPPQEEMEEVEETYEEQVDTGETRVTLEAGDRYGLRYDECQAMEAAWQRREIARQAASISNLQSLVATLQAQIASGNTE